MPEKVHNARNPEDLRFWPEAWPLRHHHVRAATPIHLHRSPLRKTSDIPHRRPDANSPLASTTAPDHEAFLAIEPKQPLMVQDQALPSQHDMQAPIAKAPSLVRQGPQPRSRNRI
jgi:hypothetical protein